MLYYKGLNENGVNVFAKSRYLSEAERISNDPEKYILHDLKYNKRESLVEHQEPTCGFKGRRVEKRLCRCLVNFGKDFNCDDCCMKAKHNLAKKIVSKNDEQIEMHDFEVAVSSGDAVGAIDLIFSFDNEKYVAEFKPKWNKETLLRMIAEIETYSYIAKRGGHFIDCKKAIVFMDNSEQFGQYFGYTLDKDGNKKDYPFKANKSISYILNELRISVFCLYDNKNEGVYTLERLK